MILNDFWSLSAGLRIFLYGTFALEDTMKQIQRRTFKLFLRDYAKNKLSAIFNGTFVTGILPSSSIVNLIVILFEEARMFTKRNAIFFSLKSYLLEA